MTDNEPDISGKLSKLRPKHYAIIGGVCVAALLVTPMLTSLIVHQQKHEESQAELNAGNLGTPWEAPAIPIATGAPVKPVLLPPALPLPSRPVLPAVVGKAPEDQALTSPMRMAGGSVMAPQPASGGTRLAAAGDDAGQEDALSAALKPTKLEGFKATRLKNPEWTIEQGRIIACTDMTAINSSLPGFVKAKLPYDVWSLDGSNILLERGSTMFGEVAHGLENGTDRLFVLWRQITTPAPNFVRITLNSPATDELGQAGLDGDVNRHMWQKIKGALILSVVQSGLQGLSAGVSSGLSNVINGNKGGGTGNTNLSFTSFQSNGSELADTYLNSTINIPDVLTRLQGQPCSAIVAGDLSFADVYRDQVVR